MDNGADFGRRIRTQNASSIGTEIYVYDGANVIEDLNASGAVLRRYVHGPGVDEPLAMNVPGSSTYYYSADRLGTVMAISTKAGKYLVETDYNYGDYGAFPPCCTSFLTGNRYYYAGREFDQETGLYYNRARYYDPVIGRFLNEDPIRFGASMNFFAYVEDNPVGWTDPSGQKTFECKAPLHSAPSLYKKAPFMFHEYLCVVGKDGKPVCVGQDREGSAIRSKGKPSEDTMERGECTEKEPDDQCVEQCVLKEGAKPRPRHGIGPQGTDCQEWADDTLNKCQKRCKKKNGWFDF